MRLLIAFLYVAHVVLAITSRGLSRDLAPMSFAELGQSVGAVDDGCGITCLPASPSGSVCKARLTTPPLCSACHLATDPAGCCFVSGYYPSVCTSVSQTADCLAAADSLAQTRSESCTTVVTCTPSCGVVEVTAGTEVICSYDTCLGEQSCAPPPIRATCEMGPWSEWSGCLQFNGLPVDCTFRSGNRFRTRTPVDPSACYDANADPTQQAQLCSKPTTECLVNCVQTPYKVYTSCPTCWNRMLSNAPPSVFNFSTVTTVGIYPGKVCDCPQQTSSGLCLKPVVCNTIPICPQDCVASAWSAWSACDKSCANYEDGFCQTCTGIQTRTRTITKQAEFGGIQCGSLTDSRSCNTQACPINCLMSTWSVWSPCTAECGGGTTTRSRFAITSPQFGGNACPAPFDQKACGTDPCPVGCVVGAWGGWDRSCPLCIADDGTANPGVRTRTRSVTTPSANGGSACPPTAVSVPCPYIYCPVDCVPAPWSQWSACSSSCDGGVQYRAREVATAAHYGGRDCAGPFDQQRPCNTQCCSVDCVWYWSVWSNPNNSSQDCSVRCGGGTQTRSVVVVVPKSCNGRECGTGKPSDMVQPCNTVPCPVDCVVSDWDKTVADCLKPEFCSSTCSLGFCVRKRTIVTYPQNGGAMCPYLEDYITCNNGPCDAPCEYSSWGSWSVCPASCGSVGTGGSQIRTRTLLNPSKVGAEQCNFISDSRLCNYNPCPKDCVVGAWSTFSPCPVTCGLGSQVRTRSVVPPQFGGAECPYAVDVTYCDRGACPVTCVVSPWQAWSPCPVTCTDGPRYYRTRHRDLLLNGTAGCALSLEETEEIPCATASCPKNCVLSQWGDWSLCQGCGLQQQSRKRNVTQEPSSGGRVCQVTDDYRLCQGPPCPVPCTFSPWSSWSPCTKSCGPGTRTRDRYLIDSGIAGSDISLCPTLVHDQPCQASSCCPVDCRFHFSEWTPCSAQGYRRRYVTIDQTASCGGIPCPTCLVERDDCTPPEDDACWLEDCPDA